MRVVFEFISNPKAISFYPKSVFILGMQSTYLIRLASR